MAIRLLDDATAARIAAGEVIERPASVVKELVENALDTGATRIDIEIDGGGSELIRVVDDGAGIAPGELQLAFQRFATSKVDETSDLLGIATLGFYIDSAFADIRFDRAIFLIVVTALLNIGIDVLSRTIRSRLRLQTSLDAG